jgi:hypothetical protein
MRNMPLGCPLAGDPELNLALESAKQRAQFNESFKASSDFGECTGGFARQRKQSNDEAGTATAKRRYAFARSIGFRRPLDQLDHRPLDFVAAHIMAVAGFTISELGISSGLDAKEYRPFVGHS